jgi:hypothetical protein
MMPGMPPMPMPPGAPSPAGPAPMPAAPPPAGGMSDNDTTFATGMLAGLGLRELSQVLGLSRRGQKQQQAGMGMLTGQAPGAPDMLAGNLGEIDKLIMLSKLMAQGGMPGAGPAPAGPGGMPGAPAPGAPGPVPGPSPLSSPAPASALAAAQPPMPGPAPAAPQGPPMAGGGVVPLLLKQMMGNAGGLV